MLVAQVKSATIQVIELPNKETKNPIARISATNIMESNDTQRELTFGEKAVGLTFNPSGDEKVNRAKRLMADALDLLKEVEAEKTDGGKAMSSWEANVFRTNAFNKTVDAQMALVKYITWNN
jgi:hypothetical protein